MSWRLAEVPHEPVLGLLDGARWYEGVGLVVADMTAGGVYRLPDPRADLDVLIPHRKGIGGLALHADGGWVVSGRNVSIKDGDDSVVLLETADDEQFFNDLGADAQGRVFVGSVAKQTDRHVPDLERIPGRLYRIDLDGTVTVVSDDVLISNGIFENADETVLFHVDSGRRLIWRLDQTKELARSVFADTSEYDGLPDGIHVTTDGSLWVAIAGAGVVVGYDAHGRRVAETSLPHPLVTDVCFGGSDLSEVYVVTGVDEEHRDPVGGRVFHARTDLVGLPSPVARVRRR